MDCYAAIKSWNEGLWVHWRSQTDYILKGYIWINVKYYFKIGPILEIKINEKQGSAVCVLGLTWVRGHGLSLLKYSMVGEAMEKELTSKWWININVLFLK